MNRSETARHNLKIALEAAESTARRLRATRALRDELEAIERSLAAKERKNGATWQQIADTWQLKSRQHAFMRFGRTDDSRA